jgi:hypothetical protein
MIGIMLLAAAQAPLLLASNDEVQWRTFVRASVQSREASSPRLRGGSRLLQLQGVVRRLGEERPGPVQRLAGPAGL